MAGKLDYVPGVLSVERHARGERTCGQCETIVQAPKAAHVIDKGIPGTGLLTQHECMLQRQQGGSPGGRRLPRPGQQHAPPGGDYPVRR